MNADWQLPTKRRSIQRSICRLANTWAPPMAERSPRKKSAIRIFLSKVEKDHGWITPLRERRFARHR
ncbi:hypothetical protein [Geobacillus sp. TFV-3]|uniref:hypothetical protein n=1 Tax=Geobacillus sp. TFV-3 TaxID=1897059 RepID=UPI001359A9C3|nr:hypothetical protein [Geobacillus sp. TFV-3]